jgi:hypothetical protein
VSAGMVGSWVDSIRQQLDVLVGGLSGWTPRAYPLFCDLQLQEYSHSCLVAAPIIGNCRGYHPAGCTCVTSSVQLGLSQQQG